MRLYLFLGWVLCPALLAVPSKLCVGPKHAPELILSVNADGPASVKALHERISTAQPLKVAERNTGPEVQFIVKRSAPGDCFLFDSREKARYKVEWPQGGNFFKSLGQLVGIGSRASELELVPVVYFRKRDESRGFGWLERAALSQLVPQAHQDTSVKSILAHPIDPRFTVLYVLCPRERTSVCTLQIKHMGKWVSDPKSGKRFSLPVLGRSRREGQSLTAGRTVFSGDTPQGIYYVWGTLFTADPVFGNLPRLDLDATMPPINSLPYELHSPVLEKLVPASALDDYWIHEWPLAFKLGRAYLRIHGNAAGDKKDKAVDHGEDYFNATSGCLNAGSSMPALLDTLTRLKIVRKEQIATPDPIHSPTLGWRVIPRIGRVFVIVKDT